MQSEPKAAIAGKAHPTKGRSHPIVPNNLECRGGDGASRGPPTQQKRACSRSSPLFGASEPAVRNRLLEAATIDGRAQDAELDHFWDVAPQRQSSDCVRKYLHALDIRPPPSPTDQRSRSNRAEVKTTARHQSSIRLHLRAEERCNDGWIAEFRTVEAMHGDRCAEAMLGSAEGGARARRR